MKALTGPLRESEPFRRILDALQKGLTPVEVTGCVVSQEAHLIAALDNTAPCRLVVTHTEEKAKKIYEDLTFFEEETMLYPSRDILFYFLPRFQQTDAYPNRTLLTTLSRYS